MKKCVKKEIKKLIKLEKLNCSIEEFKDKVDWDNIICNQKLSENFIKEFQNKVNWYNISFSQKLSENFIRKFEDKIHWRLISINQKLSENFIREFQNKVDWWSISWSQKLSEDFIEEFKNKVNLGYAKEFPYTTKNNIEKDIEEYKEGLEKQKLDKTRVKNKFKLIRF